MGDGILEHFMIADSVGKVDSSGPTAKQKELYKEYSPINHMKAGMKYPPVYMVYTTDHGIHTSLWGKKIKDKAEKIGAEACESTKHCMLSIMAQILTAKCWAVTG